MLLECGVTDSELQVEATRIGHKVETVFSAYLSGSGDGRDRLFEAMRHAGLGGGKRLRPLLTVATGKLFGLAEDRVIRAGAAIEAIHVYSLIHDDLPCMDDDVLRRGKPTVHVEFDEALALLVGDSLHSLAFQLLGERTLAENALTQVEMVAILARAAGSRGMAGGQV